MFRSRLPPEVSDGTSSLTADFVSLLLKILPALHRGLLTASVSSKFFCIQIKKMGNDDEIILKDHDVAA